jgi:hypothetical protein
VPGKYTVELSVAGRKLRQTLTVKLDPRVHFSESDLREQLDLAQQIGRGMALSYGAFKQVAALRKALEERQKALPSLKDAAAALTKKIDAADKGTRTAPGFGPANRDLTRLFSGVESGDARPSETARSAVDEICKSLDADLVKWRQLNEQDLASFNATLAAQNLSPLPVATVEARSGCGR